MCRLLRQKYLKVNVLHDIIEYYVRVNQDKEVNMQHPKDVKGSDKPKSLLSIPVGQRYTTILGRLNNIEGDLGHIEADVNDLGKLWCDSNTSINNRLDRIESEIKVMHHVVGKNILALDEIEKRIAIMQEKIDGID